MTFVTIFRNRRGECTGFNVIGHSGYASEGSDIVCAGISILVINTCNSLEELTDREIHVVTNEEEGLISCRLKDDPTKQTELLFSSMILGLKNLEEMYGDYIQLTFEEV